MAEESGEPACMLGDVCPECGRVVTDEDAPPCEVCRDASLGLTGLVGRPGVLGGGDELLGR